MALDFNNTDTLTSVAAAAEAFTEIFDSGGAFAVIATLDLTLDSGSSGSIDVKLQHSPDQSTWYDVASGAFANVTTIPGTPEVLTFTTGLFYRYFRWAYTVNAGDRIYSGSIHATGRSS